MYCLHALRQKRPRAMHQSLPISSA
jgi:hypothetical protein